MFLNKIYFLPGLFLHSHPHFASSNPINCVDIINEGCISLDSTLTNQNQQNQQKKCRITSAFGPIMSRCLTPGKFMFNKATTKHGQFQDPIRAICSGDVVRSGRLLHGGEGFAVVTEHPFREKCLFNGMEYESFQIYYGHADGADGIDDVKSVIAGDVFAYLNNCQACVGMSNQPILLILVKIGKTFVNPLALLSSRTTSQNNNNDNKFLASFYRMGSSIGLLISTPCEDLTLNRYEIKCGAKNYVYDVNTREGFNELEVNGPPPHTQDTSVPFIDPTSVPFHNGKWYHNVVIPKSWYGDDMCCDVTLKDVWGDTRWSGSQCFHLREKSEGDDKWSVCLPKGEQCGLSNNDDISSGRSVVSSCNENSCKKEGYECHDCGHSNDSNERSKNSLCVCRDKLSICHKSSIGIQQCMDQEYCGGKCIYTLK